MLPFQERMKLLQQLADELKSRDWIAISNGLTVFVYKSGTTSTGRKVGISRGNYCWFKGSCPWRRSRR